MKKPDISKIEPHINKLLQGIQTEETIDPIAHAHVFEINCELQEYFVVQTTFQTNKVYYGNMLICQIRWLDDGVEFFPHRESFALVEMMAAVLLTIKELQE